MHEKLADCHKNCVTMGMMMTNNRREFLKIVGTFTAAAITNKSFSANTNQKRPNILFIMSDDHAAHAIGAYGGRLASLNPTPNLDRLAHEGIRLNNVFCTNSICVPSRATLMTGQYSHTNGVNTLNDRLPRDRHDLSLLMQQAGYQTAMIGKWH